MLEVVTGSSAGIGGRASAVLAGNIGGTQVVGITSVTVGGDTLVGAERDSLDWSGREESAMVAAGIGDCN